MNDQFIFSDGINVYATFESRINKGMKWGLIAANIIVYGLFFFVISQMSESQRLSLVFLIIGIPVFLFFTLTRYTLWNLFGRETLIINTHSMSYQNDYGWFSFRLKTFETPNGIRFGVQDEFLDHGQLYVSIWFQYYDQNKLPQDLYTTALRTEIDGYHKLRELIDEIYAEEVPEGFSLN